MGKFKKIGKYNEHSYHLKNYRGIRIFPLPVDQGPHPTCYFAAVAKGFEMTLYKNYADCDVECDIDISYWALVKDYCELHNIKLEDIGEPEERKVDRLQSIKSIGHVHGLLSTTSSLWENEVRIQLDGIHKLPCLTFEQLAAKLKKGIPILAEIVVLSSDFCFLKEDEIYSTTAKFINGKVQRPHGYHAVVVIGCGDDVTEPVTFLNSHSWNIGHIMFKDLLVCYEFYIKHPPTLLNEAIPRKDQQSMEHSLAVQPSRYRAEDDGKNRYQAWNNNRSRNNNHYQNNHKFDQLVVNVPCPCGVGSCIVRTIMVGYHTGRKFYRCPAHGKSCCGFFRWRDDQQQIRIDAQEWNQHLHSCSNKGERRLSMDDKIKRRYSHLYRSPPSRGYGSRGRSPPGRGYEGHMGQSSGSLLVRNIPSSCSSNVQVDRKLVTPDGEGFHADRRSPGPATRSSSRRQYDYSASAKRKEELRGKSPKQSNEHDARKQDDYSASPKRKEECWEKSPRQTKEREVQRSYAPDDRIVHHEDENCCNERCALRDNCSSKRTEEPRQAKSQSQSNKHDNDNGSKEQDDNSAARRTMEDHRAKSPRQSKEHENDKKRGSSTHDGRKDRCEADNGSRGRDDYIASRKRKEECEGKSPRQSKEHDENKKRGSYVADDRNDPHDAGNGCNEKLAAPDGEGYPRGRSPRPSSGR